MSENADEMYDNKYLNKDNCKRCQKPVNNRYGICTPCRREMKIKVEYSQSKKTPTDMTINKYTTKESKP